MLMVLWIKHIPYIASGVSTWSQWMMLFENVTECLGGSTLKCTTGVAFEVGEHLPTYYFLCLFPVCKMKM